MAKWFEVEKTIAGINSFLDCNWDFHDFRLENISYTPGKDMAEVFLKYDTRKEGRLLRFIDLYGLHPVVEQYYESHWLSGSGCFLTDRDTLIWADDADGWSCSDPERLKKKFNEIKDGLSWIEAKRVFWAVTDADGKPLDVPGEYIPIYNVDKQEYTDFIKNNLKVFDGNWDAIFPSWY